jgi:hypothetical protein
VGLIVGFMLVGERVDGAEAGGSVSFEPLDDGRSEDRDLRDPYGEGEPVPFDFGCSVTVVGDLTVVPLALEFSAVASAKAAAAFFSFCRCACRRLFATLAL